MKKSNALMLSYIIFLVISLVAYVFCNWNGIDKIAVAATIACYFFALADYSDCKSTFNKYYCDKSKSIQSSLIDIDVAEIEFLEERKEELESILEKAVAYQGRNSRFDYVIVVANELLETDKKDIEEYEKLIAQDTKLYEEKEKESNKKYDVVSSVLMVLGFVSFFSVIVFDYFADWFSSTQSFLTVIAFIIIMFTYYSKDVIQSNTKAKLNELTEKLEHNKKKQEEIILEYKNLNLVNTIDQFIEKFKEQDETSNILEEIE